MPEWLPLAALAFFLLVIFPIFQFVVVTVQGSREFLKYRDRNPERISFFDFVFRESGYYSDAWEMLLPHKMPQYEIVRKYGEPKFRPPSHDYVPPPVRPVLVAPSRPFHPDRNHLQQLCHTLLSRFPDMPEPLVTVMPPSHFQLTRGLIPLAHARIGTPPLIEFNSEYLKTATEASLIDTMKHELIHHWLYRHGFTEEYAHGRMFELAAKLVGAYYTTTWILHDKERTAA